MEWNEINQIANKAKDALWNKVKKVYDSPGACPDISKIVSSALDKMDTTIEVIHGLHPDARLDVVTGYADDLFLDSIMVFYSFNKESKDDWNGYVQISIWNGDVKHTSF